MFLGAVSRSTVTTQTTEAATNGECMFKYFMCFHCRVHLVKLRDMYSFSVMHFTCMRTQRYLKGCEIVDYNNDTVVANFPHLEACSVQTFNPSPCTHGLAGAYMVVVCYSLS